MSSKKDSTNREKGHSLELAGELVLSGVVNGDIGRLRLNDNADTPCIEYSNDSGKSWNRLASDALKWLRGCTYEPGALVLHRSRWHMCRIATSSAVPGDSAEWSAVTDAVTTYRVKNSAQLKSALEADVRSMTIIIEGDLTAAVEARLSATCVTIYSDESVATTADSLSFVCKKGANVYWHANGTRMISEPGAKLSISMSGGVLWLGRVSVPAGALYLTGDVRYSRVDGHVTGGTQANWCGALPSMPFVPLFLGSLPLVEYADDLKVYVSGEKNGHISAGMLLERMASKAAGYLSVHGQGSLSKRPEAVDVQQGYVYYATDNGSLYIKGSSGWNDGIRVQGKPGPRGTPGKDGIDGISPTVSVSRTADGCRVLITDRGYPGGQEFTIKHGADGVSPVFAIGTVSTLEPGKPASVSIGGTPGSPRLNFGIPRGADGTGLPRIRRPLWIANGELSIDAYPAVAISKEIEVLTVEPGKAYDISGKSVASISLTLAGSRDKFGECWLRVRFGDRAEIEDNPGLTVVNQPVPGETNLMRLEFWGVQARLYVYDHWAE